MKYQIKDQNGNIVDRNLTYEEALFWTDTSIERYYGNRFDGPRYTMELMEE